MAQTRIAVAILAVLAACSPHGGLGIDVTDAPGSATSVAVIVVANDTCTINGMPCSEWGSGVSLDGTAPTPGAIDEITGYNEATLVNGSATLVVPLVDPPDNFYRVAVVAIADQKAVAALVFQQVHITSERAQLTTTFEPANGSSMPNGAAHPVELTFDPVKEDRSVDEPMLFPCFAVDVDGSREYYVPANNHDCDNWAVTDPVECDDLWSSYPGGLPAAPAIQQCVGTANGGTCATASCADGTGLCTPILGSGSVATYPPGTQCFPPEVCSGCPSGSASDDPSCWGEQLGGVITNALAGTDAGILNCTVVIAGSNNTVCSAFQPSPYSFEVLPAECSSVSVRTLPVEVPVGVTTMAIAGTSGSDGAWRVPYVFSGASSTTPSCSITFGSDGSNMPTQSGTGNSDFVFDITLENHTRVELPVHVEVEWLGSGTDCAGGQGSSACQDGIDASGDYLSCGL